MSQNQSHNIFHTLYPTFNHISSCSGINHTYESMTTSFPHEKYSYNALNDMYTFLLSKVSDNVRYVDELKKAVKQEIWTQAYLARCSNSINGLASTNQMHAGYGNASHNEGAFPNSNQHYFYQLTPTERRNVVRRFADFNRIDLTTLTTETLLDASIGLGLWIMGKKLVQIDEINICDSSVPPSSIPPSVPPSVPPKIQYKVWISEINDRFKCIFWMSEFSKLFYVSNNNLVMISTDFGSGNHVRTEIGPISGFEIPSSFAHMHGLEKWIVFRSLTMGKCVYFSIWRKLSVEEYLGKVAQKEKNPSPLEYMGVMKFPICTYMRNKTTRFNLRPSSFLFDRFIYYHSTSEFLQIDMDELITTSVTPDYIVEFDPDRYLRSGGSLYILSRISSDTIIYNDPNLALRGLILMIDVIEKGKLFLKLSNNEGETEISISIAKENEVPFQQLVKVEYPYLLIGETYSLNVFIIQNTSPPKIDFIYRLDSSETNTDGTLKTLFERKRKEVAPPPSNGSLNLRRKPTKNYCEIPLYTELCHNAETPTIIVRTADITSLYDMKGKNLLTVHHKEPDTSFITTLYPLLQGFVIGRQKLTRRERRIQLEMQEDQRRDWDPMED